jgi:hypothetical protein
MPMAQGFWAKFPKSGPTPLDEKLDSFSYSSPPAETGRRERGHREPGAAIEAMLSDRA